RENQAGLSRRIVRVEKIGKFQAGEMIAKWRHRGLHSIACKIHPFQKVGDLVPTNAESDLKYLRIRDFLTQGCVETGATLLDLSKVKGRHVRDGLNVIVSRKVRVGLAFVIGVTSGNGGNSIESDCLWKGGAEVWTGCAAIADEPAGVDVKLREVGEARCTRGPGSRASRQSYKLLEVDRFGPSGLEIGIEESSVADFVQRVAGDILRAIGIEIRQGDLIRVQGLVRVYFDRRIIADATQFRILNPKVGLNQFGGREESQDRDISFAEGCTAGLLGEGR